MSRVSERSTVRVDVGSLGALVRARAAVLGAHTAEWMGGRAFVLRGNHDDQRVIDRDGAPVEGQPGFRAAWVIEMNR